MSLTRLSCVLQTSMSVWMMIRYVGPSPNATIQVALSTVPAKEVIQHQKEGVVSSQEVEQNAEVHTADIPDVTSFIHENSPSCLANDVFSQ